ncbi:MAG: hypothetical protein IJ567_05580 [Lachnospiraceae bacterium]|nr:hypothetical protein [Lachnospiraceae bacterium]
MILDSIHEVQADIIQRLAEQNKHLISLLAQYTAVEAEEERLREILGKEGEK